MGTPHLEKRRSLKICRPWQINTKTPSGMLRLRCLPIVAKALTLPVSLIELISISLSLELIFFLGPSVALVTACLFKLTNGCDHGCCMFSNINRKLWPAALGLRLDFNIFKNIPFNQDFVWWMSVRGKCLWEGTWEYAVWTVQKGSQREMYHTAIHQHEGTQQQVAFFCLSDPWPH